MPRLDTGDGPDESVGQFFAGTPPSFALGRFRIAGGSSGLKVSWQVTGARKDPFILAHQPPVEQDKPPAERGTYMHPELYGQPEEKSLEWALQPELQRQIKAAREAAATPQ